MGGVFGGMGGGSSSHTTNMAPTLTQEQKDLLKAQTDALTKFYLPSYKQTTQGAGNVYNQTLNAVNRNMGNASNILGQNQAQLGRYGSDALRTGSAGLQKLFDRGYEEEQVKASTQPYQEEATQEQAKLAAKYGGAGGLGSSRARLASQNLSSLNAARMGNVSATTRAGIANQRSDVGKYLVNSGQEGLKGAAGAAQQLISNAQIPQDIYSKYASVVFGNPQSSLTPNFQGTQGSNTSGSGHSFNWGVGGRAGF